MLTIAGSAVFCETCQERRPIRSDVARLMVRDLGLEPTGDEHLLRTATCVECAPNRQPDMAVFALHIVH